MSNLQMVKDELTADFSVKKVVLKWVFGEISFERNEFLTLWQLQDQILHILNKAFLERQVMYMDLKKEDPEWSAKSLFEVSDFLDSSIKELAAKTSAQNKSLIRLLEEFRSQSVVFAKKLRNTNAEMEEGNKGELESEYKVRPCDWVPPILSDFRLAIYPIVRTLIEILPEGDRGRERIEDTWFHGLDVLQDTKERFKSEPTLSLIRPAA